MMSARPAHEDRSEAGASRLESRLAGALQSLAQGDRKQHVGQHYLKQQGQAQFNQFLQSGVQAARETELPFLRTLQGSVYYDFNTRRSALQFLTIDEVYRGAANTGLLQLGLHNQNHRVTGSAGAVLRHQARPQLYLGVNSFLDYEFAKQTSRASVGLEAIAPQFTLFGNVYAPASGWRGAKRDDRRDERAAAGVDVGIKVRPEFAPGLSFHLSHFRWKGGQVDYFDNGRLTADARGLKYGVEYRPVPMFSLGLEQSRVHGGDFQTRVQLGISFTLSEPLAKQLRPVQAINFDLEQQRIAPVERENRIVLKTRSKPVAEVSLQVTSVVFTPTTGLTTVSGTTEPGSLVTITSPDTAIGSVQADSQGRFAFTPGKRQPSGVFLLQARSRSGVLSPVVSVAYSAPEHLALIIRAVTTSPVDRTVSVEGETQPNLQVMVTFTDGSSLRAMSDAKGVFQARSRRALPDGDISAQAQDPVARAPILAVQPYKPPQHVPPTIDQVLTNTPAGRVTLVGKAGPNADLDVLFTDGATVRVNADAAGRYEAVSRGLLPAGELRVTRVPVADEEPVYRTQPYGDASDTTSPEMPVISSVSDGKGGMTVSGMAEPLAQVEVTFPTGAIERVPVNADGVFVAYSVAKEIPSGQLSAVAIDEAGNRSAAAHRAYLAKEFKSAVIAPAITSAQGDPLTGLVTVTGTAGPKATLKIEWPGGETQETVVDETGDYTVSSTRPAPSGAIVVTATGPDGKPEGKAERAFVAPVPVIAAPTMAAPLTDAASGRVTINGKAPPGSTVTVTFTDGTSKEIPAGDDGSFQAISDKDIEAGPIRAQARDAAGHHSEVTTQAYADTVDVTAPAAPTITAATPDAAGLVTVTGRAEPGATVTVRFTDGSTKDVPAGEDGRYTASSERDIESGDIRAQARDGAGNRSGVATHTYADMVDATPPADPVITAATAAAGTGLVTVTGRAEPGATVTVRFTDGSTRDVPAGDDGRYTATSDHDIDSGNITAQARDAAGNNSGVVTYNYRDTVDVTPPADPVITAATAAAGTGLVTVTGTAERGATVTVTFSDGSTKAVIAGEDGSYTATSDADIESGDITAQARDADGNSSRAVTHHYEDRVDATPPTAPVITEARTAPGTGLVTVTGTAEPGAMVTVTFTDGSTKDVPVDVSGNYTATSDKDIESGNITAQARDAANNRSGVATRAYADTVDATPPADPVITSAATDAATGRVTVTGMAEPLATVTVTFTDGSTKDAKAGDDGRYTATSDRDIESGDITVQARDAAGNRSNAVTHRYLDAVDKTPPAAPVIISANADPATGFVSVIGTAEPASMVRVRFPDATEQSVRAGDDGRYSVTSERDMVGGDIRVTASDEQGNVSPETTSAYVDAVDVTAPPAPSIDAPVTDPGTGRVTVTGGAEPRSNVTVRFPDGSNVIVVAGRDGRYQARSDNNIETGEIQVFASDAAKNVSDTARRDYVDEVLGAPTIATVATDGTGRITVSGRAQAPGTVVLTFPGGEERSVATDPAGNFSAQSSGDVPGGEIRAMSTAAGVNSAVTVRRYDDAFTPFSLRDVVFPDRGATRFLMPMSRNIGTQHVLFEVLKPNFTATLNVPGQPVLRDLATINALPGSGVSFRKQIFDNPDVSIPTGDYPATITVTDLNTRQTLVVPGIVRWRD